MGDLSQREIEAIVAKLSVDMVECKHHYRGWIMHAGKRIGLLHYSRGRKGLSGGAARSFAKDLRLSMRECSEFGRCRFGQDEYFDRVRDRPLS